MSDKRIFVLAHKEARIRAVACVAEAPDGYVVTVLEPNKRRIQEEKYHAMMGAIAKQCGYHGKKLHKESWKRLLLEAFVYIVREEAKAQGKPDPFPCAGELLPSLDGMRIVQVEVLSRGLTVGLASLLIEYLFAYGAENGVVWTDQAYYAREVAA